MLDLRPHILPGLSDACAQIGIVAGSLVGRRNRAPDRFTPQAPPAPAAPSEVQAKPLLEVSDAVFLYDVSHARFTAANPAGEAMWGRASHDLLADPASWLVSIDPDDHDIARLLLCAPTPGVTRTLRLSLPGGETRWVRGRSCHSGGQTMCLFEDVTRAVLERTALAPGRRPSAVASIIGGFAHEARGALQGLLGLTEAMAARFAGDELAERYLPLLGQELARLQQLTSELVACGTDLHLAPQPLSVERIARAAVDRCATLAPERGVSVELRLRSPAGRAWLDPERGVDLVAELVDHALRRTPAGRTVIVEVADAPDALAGSVEVAVHDEGPALAAGDVDAVFRPFVAGPGGVENLRLALARRIAEEHRGSLVARRRPEGGLSFVIRLPVDSTTALAS